MKKLHLKHFWLIAATYGVWFAVFSGLEELSRGKYWKVVASLVLGLFIFLIIEMSEKNK